VPDAPVSSFQATFPEGPHSILGAFSNLCEAPLLAPTTIVGQNGAELTQDTRIAVSGCGATLSIARVRFSAGSVLVSVRLSKPGVVRVSGAGLRATSRSLPAGTQQLRVKLTAAGRRVARHRGRLKVQAQVGEGTQSVTKSATVKT
jgi:hypothetical protein